MAATSTLSAPVLDRASHALLDPAIMVENKVCPGCKKTVVTEDGSVVVAFGQSLFHVDCFKCAKCNNQVTADTNLLLLSDGSPVCADCSYCCNVCGQPILDEAIMTGDDAYHAHCFNCKVCKKRIDELVFAKTSQGIYCMDCHNERVARSRRHQQRREKEKARERAAGEASSVKARENVVREGSQDASRNSREGSLKSRSGSIRSKNRPGTSDSVDQASTGSRVELRRDSASSLGERSLKVKSPPQIHQSISLPASSAAASAPATTAPPPIRSKRYSTMLSTSASSPPESTSGDTITSTDHARSATLPVSRADTLTVPSDNKTLQKRKSFNDRPLNVLLKETTNEPVQNDNANGLLIPNGGTSRKDKRRSINPTFTLSYNGLQEPSQSPTATSFVRSQTPPVQDRLQSPRQDYFPISNALSPPPFTDSPKLNVNPLSQLSPQTDETNRLYGRTRSASSATYDPSRGMDQNAALRPRPSVTLDRVPARSSSRIDLSSPQRQPAGYTPASSPDGGRTTPQYSEGRISPSTLNIPNGVLRTQKSFDDRYRPSTSSLRNSGSTIELAPGSGNSSRPTSPAHRADVPHGIESGTDTEAEGEDTRRTHNGRYNDDRPPAPPPKEGKAGKRPPDLKLNTVVDNKDDASDAGQLDSEVSSEVSHESSPVEQTSRSTFIAPALPPIRFSLGAADFSDLLKSVGGPQSLKSLAEAKEDPSTTLSAGTTSTAASKTSNDVTPVKRRDLTNSRDPDITIRRERSSSRSQSPSPLSSNSSNGHSATLPRAAGDSVKRSLDGYGDRTSRTSLDIPYSRQRSYSASRSDQSPRPSLDSRLTHQREMTEPTLSNILPSTRVTLTPAENNPSALSRPDSADLIRRRLQEAVNDASARGSEHVKLNMEFVNAILMLVDHRSQEFNDMKRRLDGMKRASQQYMDGLTVAQTEYDRELRARRDAEAEVTRLRILLSGQAARLTAISGDSRRQEAQRALSRELSDSLSILEKDLSKLKVERDMTLAEVEELSATKSNSTIADEGGDTTMKIGRSLSMRFDNIKNQYEHELLPLTQKRENLFREIEELKASRNAFLEETTMLNARNEELAQLNAQYARRMEASGMDPSHIPERLSEDKNELKSQLTSSTTSSTVALTEESADSKFIRTTKPDVQEQHTPQSRPKFIKWPGKAAKELFWPDANKQKPRAEHAFLQVSVLRVARCDHCGDKMWGSQLRCSNCSIAVHTRCVHQVHLACSQQANGQRDEAPSVTINAPGPSLFGRDLTEQVKADWKDEQNFVPVIVEKCIDAVDLLGLEYEGIYRKTGGSRLSKLITQLFESGDYASFDLRDTDRFNDICSITSVLKTYFRSLPNPLLTFELHENFISAANVKDPAVKLTMISELVQELPREHYHTLRSLMLHLHRVCQRSETNLMHARNLGVVFGPTLMRSRDPNAEFSDMAGKALSIECLVEHAPTVFSPPS
ncbi:unnamed protein product [Somion occarium]|uniref:RhoGAP-domain-containing protein n=2 Tax=Somion occarium TaxID=3059160 RepID=A0ABP1DIY6_9APHY